ncbi:hypothetical protein PCANC_13423 [Puccinia coronata f. sp. avenae]|uniref:Uncharacterized protein n=1 Tax=Puccinia coronata f. sp. avenae TaxID=200324 RepID=A0A2N5V2G5_9BASI|nr:hypothetical protein PCANC_13423 [Puccinia coronata f. sp. avenae]
MLADSLTKAAPHSSLKKLQEKCLKVLLPTTKEGWLAVPTSKDQLPAISSPSTNQNNMVQVSRSPE